MTKATRGFHERILVTFDFDQTLAPGTVAALLARLGVEDVEAWSRERLQPLVDDGWDEIIAHGPALVQTAREHGHVITRDLVREVARDLPIYQGVADTLELLRQRGRDASDGAEVELYVLSCGFEEIMCQSAISDAFDAMWGSALHWSDAGELLGVKRTVIHSEKARYLMALAKGLSMTGSNEPQDVHLERPIEQWHAPYDQMIYVGDGVSDIAAFHLMRDNGGVALAVNQSDDPSDWEAAKHMFDGARVDNLAPPSFEPEGELRQSLLLAIESIGKRVALRRLARLD